MSFPTCAVMVLNWNGASWLKKCLPSVIMAAGEVDAEVWVVDNNSEDQSAIYCEQEFPGVRFEALDSNKVLASYNVAATRCTAEVLVFLNNDVIVGQHFLVPLLSQLDNHPDVFAVAPCVRTFPPNSGSEIEVEAEVPKRINGMIRGSRVPSDVTTYTWYTLGGAMACNRIKFLELQGFDELYLPGYGEDVDICWRAWKHGWVCLYEPQSIVYHAGGSSFGRSDRVRTLILRNEYLCHWKNLSSFSLILSHILTTMPRLLTALIRRDQARLKGFAHAIARSSLMMQSRRRVQSQFKHGDVEILSRFNHPQL